MSLLYLIPHFLNTNIDADVCCLEERISAKCDTNYIHCIDYGVVPKKPLFNVDELNAFMKSLVPIEPDFLSDFSQDKYRMQFGCLCFDEKVGREYDMMQKAIIIEDEGLKQMPDFKRYETVKSGGACRELMRRISVSVYPCGEIMHDLFHEHSGEHAHNHGSISSMPPLTSTSIDNHLLGHYKPKIHFLGRILRRQ